MKPSRKILTIILAFCIFCISACNQSESADAPLTSADIPEQTVMILTQTSEEITKVNAPVFDTEESTLPSPAADIVSSLAKSDYLDFDSSSKPRTEKPEFVMLHFTSAVVLDRNDPYNIEKVRGIFEDYEIGIHYVICRNGEILCWLPEERAAWHAGPGQLDGRPEYTDKLNQYSIGIEILAIGSQQDMSQYLLPAEYGALDPALIGYTEEQYRAVSSLLDDICARYGIPKTREFIIGHDEYAPGKTDPGELFDWEKALK